MTTKYSEGCELVRRWRASGKNQSEFCRAVGIAPQRLHYWRQRVREEDLEPPKAAPSFVAVQQLAVDRPAHAHDAAVAEHDLDPRAGRRKCTYLRAPL